MSERLVVGIVVGVHGVRGLVRVKPFTLDPFALGDYGLLSDESGTRSFRVTVKNALKDQLLCSVEGVADRDAALALKGTRLCIERDRLPDDALDEDEYYHADLIGLPVELADGTPLGSIRAVEDYGAGDLLDIVRPQGQAPVMVPFTRACVPVVDLANRRVVVDPPAGLLDDPENRPRQGTPGRGRG
ncbi:ribosome maturation factor RimM [Phaeovibrio sulfidiphilus]|uniref:Ribosome maturation factor RimM n=1 Tax=Phaeovibrio sulfidiphilus TaxID=1220600 RepID=A0A8J6YP59_9PROT|nr:ribosome maturation factor RimM [Phaeovibrio sulfidiphilus]